MLKLFGVPFYLSIPYQPQLYLLELTNLTDLNFIRRTYLKFTINKNLNRITSTYLNFAYLIYLIIKLTVHAYHLFTSLYITKPFPVPLTDPC